MVGDRSKGGGESILVVKMWDLEFEVAGNLKFEISNLKGFVIFEN